MAMLSSDLVNDECKCTVVQERPTAGMQREKKGDFEEKQFRFNLFEMTEL